MGGPGGRGIKKTGGHNFSGKKKKELLKAKRNKKREQQSHQHEYQKNDDDNLKDEDAQKVKVSDLQLTQSYSKAGLVNKLTSQFVRLSDDLVQKRKADSDRPLDLSKRAKGLHCPQVQNVLGLPKRPLWNADTTKEELEKREREMFNGWLEEIHSKYSFEQLSPFEHNLEVWRQLWRTIEKSSVVVIIVDIRNPLLHIPIALYEYIVHDMKLPLVLVLNKVDLVSQEFIDEWYGYLSEKFPTTKIVGYTSKAKSTLGKGGVAHRRKLITSHLTKADRQATLVNSRKVLDVCISVWKERYTVDSVQRAKGYPTIGFVGHPNVGKSSVLNSIIGSKVVSVSRTCGHTKHWQTHFVREETGAGIEEETEEGSGDKIIAELCDSPGLVFPFIWDKSQEDGFVARHVYELCGLYPIPQIRETFSAIRILAEYVEVERLYNLKQDTESYGEEWSPYGIIGTLADKKGYTLSKGGGPDLHRAGLEIIRDVVDGYVLLVWNPPATDQKVKENRTLSHED
mmetsp:Transcript_16621/g.19917  ORF Transcript_16621/g.19917 Transcript_16621/m.19917 type:complete len:511 (+) Transcript_16621:185-1717(+)|eukprot:CAMPEP_0204831542 /NCGR_PEP_ID=MMETSP1346-20131115/10845_1 /ASSEMBLY_ACC=CAM_ASM_000771 /TAXON_ID=215587 /ORGANISM="Aplanochytrium stocchinoi, Strain GSBS06" /LENGTH=510 /DNA_ID=CAMNT_0051962639 /DNA_START=94 /DNA_END=1626 /DNA_ORIENTATION=+